MESELTSKVINNDDNGIFLNDNNYQFNKYKTKENKIRIIFGIVLLFILGLVIALVYKSFIVDSSENIEEDVTLNNKRFLNLPSDPEFKKFYEAFPHSLKLNENGKAEYDHSALDSTSPSKLIYLKEDKYLFNKIEIEEESSSSNSEIVDFSIAGNFKFLFHCDVKFKSKIEEAKKESKKSLFLIIKKVLSSLTIKRSDIEINESFKKKIEDIADEDSFSDEEKAIKLDKIFNEYGNFIPLTIKIGGYFYQDAKNIENENLINEMKNLKSNVNLTFSSLGSLNSNIDYDKSYKDFFKNLFSSEKIQIIGGDTTKKSFEEWETSLTYENAQIIEHSNFIEISSLIDDFLDTKRKMKLEKSLNLVNKKYEKRKEYYDNINEAKQYINSIDISGAHTKRNGICYKDDLIYSEITNIDGNKETIIDISFKDIIVGWKITSLRNDGKNGDFSFSDPILEKKIYMKFTPKSGIFSDRDQKYNVEIFLMKIPE